MNKLLVFVLFCVEKKISVTHKQALKLHARNRIPYVKAASPSIDYLSAGGFDKRFVHWRDNGLSVLLEGHGLDND